MALLLIPSNLAWFAQSSTAKYFLGKYLVGDRI